MIVTKEPQVISQEDRITERVYMEACNRFHNSAKRTVEFDIKSYMLILLKKNEIVAVLNEDGTPQMIPLLDPQGDPVMRTVMGENGLPSVDANGNRLYEPVMQVKTEQIVMIHPRLQPLKSQKAIFKYDTFKNHIGEVWEEDYDNVLMQQIAYVNSREWTGTEIMKKYYWELGLNDMEIVTNQQLQTLLTPYREVN